MTNDALNRELHRLVSAAQRRWHTPGISAGIVREGQVLWTGHVGAARVDPIMRADNNTQYMIGSVTKTFTAVTIMSLRDEGKLSLDDTLGRWFPESRHAAVPLRQMLAHASGLQREPLGRIWESLDAPDAQTFVRDLEDVEQVLPPHHAFHYSNLAYGLLGQIIERVEGRAWEDIVRERVLAPLGMSQTGLTPRDDRAIGYQIDPYTGVAEQEPLFSLEATAALGGLWSTVEDMLRYAAFVADPTFRPGVLAPETVDEMCRPIIMTTPETWGGAYGLGYGMTRRGDRIFVGHGGAMPGYLTGLRVRRSDRLGAIVFCNTTAQAAPTDLAMDLLEKVLDIEPTIENAWVPERPDAELAQIAGLWWSEGDELVFYIDGGQLWSRLSGNAAADRTRYVKEGEDLWRAVEGRERGERLELVRDETGALTKMYFATYAVTREPTAFANLS